MNEMPHIGISFVHKNLHENLTWKTNYSWDAPSCIYRSYTCLLQLVQLLQLWIHNLINTMNCKCPLQLKNWVAYPIVKPLQFKNLVANPIIKPLQLDNLVTNLVVIKYFNSSWSFIYWDFTWCMVKIVSDIIIIRL